VKASKFVDHLRRKFKDEYEIGGDKAIAMRLGISAQTLRNWQNTRGELEPFQITNALLKAEGNAVENAQYQTIRAIVEFYEIECVDSKGGSTCELLPRASEGTSMQNSVREELQGRNGLYLFYDSRGRALYVGKARRQSLWKEMNLAFNRSREEVQSIKLVQHPSRGQSFKPGYKHARQPAWRSLKPYDLASYFSAYWVVDGMIDDLEALIVRGFANDLLNIKMERFQHVRALGPSKPGVR
jgi:hypothetical protein